LFIGREDAGAKEPVRGQKHDKNQRFTWIDVDYFQQAAVGFDFVSLAID
jgi:hypothetical protein